MTPIEHIAPTTVVQLGTEQVELSGGGDRVRVKIVRSYGLLLLRTLRVGALGTFLRTTTSGGLAAPRPRPLMVACAVGAFLQTTTSRARALAQSGSGPLKSQNQ